MLNMCLGVFVIFMCVIGIYQFVKEVTAHLLKNDAKSTVIIEIADDVNSTEYTVRSVLSANPKSDIVIINKTENEEIAEILSKLSQKNSRIYIKTAPEK